MVGKTFRQQFITTLCYFQYSHYANNIFFSKYFTYKEYEIGDNIIVFLLSPASHRIGASSCIPISTTQVAFASLAIALVGILTAILAPLFIALAQYLCYI